MWRSKGSIDFVFGADRRPSDFQLPPWDTLLLVVLYWVRQWVVDVYNELVLEGVLV